MSNVVSFDQPVKPEAAEREAQARQDVESPSVERAEAPSDATGEAAPPTSTSQPAPEPSSGAPAKLPPGTCLGCGALVQREAMELWRDKPPSHRVKASRADLVGNICGPVATGWDYHVVVQLANGQRKRGRVVLRRPIEQDGLLDAAEAIVAQQNGWMPEDVEIHDWKQLAHMFEREPDQPS